MFLIKLVIGICAVIGAYVIVSMAMVANNLHLHF